MACYDTDPYLCTYDSNAGAGKDYSSVSAWETDTDIDISGYGILILDCYDSQDHDDGNVDFAGATGLDATHYRCIRSSPSCATPFAGKVSTGAYFNFTGNNIQIFKATEYYFRFQDLSLKMVNARNAQTYGIYLVGRYTKAINCIGQNCNNTNGSRVIWAFATAGDARDSLFYNCMAYSNEDDGFHSLLTSNRCGIICCTAIGNGNHGFWASSNKTFVFSCYGANNTTADFLDNSAYWEALSDYNSSKDATSDLGGGATNYENNNDETGNMDSDYLATATLGHGRNPYNDITATIDFNDFFKNDAGGEDISKDDIAGQDRPTPDTADVTWDIGASEYVAAAPSAFIPKVIMIN